MLEFNSLKCSVSYSLLEDKYTTMVVFIWKKKNLSQIWNKYHQDVKKFDLLYENLVFRLF